MRRFMPFVTFALAVAFLLSFPMSSAEAKRLPVKERKKMADPFKLLTLDQFAKLAYWRRVQYVREMRKAVVDAEKMQYLYRFGKFSAGIESVRKNKDLYALLFGADANAQTGGRGRNVTDQCIYAFWLSDYGGDVRP